MGLRLWLCCETLKPPRKMHSLGGCHIIVLLIPCATLTNIPADIVVFKMLSLYLVVVNCNQAMWSNATGDNAHDMLNCKHTGRLVFWLCCETFKPPCKMKWLHSLGGRVCVSRPTLIPVAYFKYSSNTTRWRNSRLMLAERRRRWAFTNKKVVMRVWICLVRQQVNLRDDCCDCFVRP